MGYYGIANTCGTGSVVRLGKGSPDLLALGDQGEALAVFRSDAVLQAFIRTHRSLKTNDSKPVEVFLGASFLEVAETVSQAVEKDKIELIVFDPVLDADGTWVDEGLRWPMGGFCDFMLMARPVVMDIARRKEGIPANRRPSSKAMEAALAWYMGRLADYRNNTSEQ